MFQMTDNKMKIERTETYAFHHIPRVLVNMIVVGLCKVDPADAQQAAMQNDLLQKINEVMNDGRE
jgi:hypothetical protein